MTRKLTVVGGCCGVFSSTIVVLCSFSRSPSPSEVFVCYSVSAMFFVSLCIRVGWLRYSIDWRRLLDLVPISLLSEVRSDLLFVGRVGRGRKGCWV